MAFESDRIPARWRDNLACYDAIWVPTRWGHDVLTACGVPADKIRIVQEGVNSKNYLPKPIPHEGFVFFFVGKYEKRKGINELIMAFIQEFPRADYPAVILRLKADFPMFPELLQKLKENAAFDDRIQILEGDLTDGQMVTLYNGADAFVFPSRAEGFGLPCIEALACGLPMIATNVSGQAEFLREIEGLFVPIAYEMENIEDFVFDYFYKKIYAGEPYGRWAKPDIASIRQGMRQIYKNHAEWKEKARRASEIIRNKFDCSESAQRAIVELI
jgi:glycosyltransferase involved in cell wall biosynthesis